MRGNKLPLLAFLLALALTAIILYVHPGGAAPKPEQRRFITDPGAFAWLLEDCRRQVKGRPDEAIGVAPHSLRAVTPQELSEIIALSSDGPIHIHVAEQVKEVEDCLAWSGARPPARRSPSVARGPAAAW